MPGNVTVGVDGTPESLAALDWAAAEAVLREVPLRIVHIQDWPVPPAYIEHVETWPSSSAVPESSERFRKYEELLQQEAATAQRSHPGLTVTAENLAGVGLASTALLAEAEMPGRVDLLVLGSKGLDSFTGFVIGTTSLPVAAASERPVVLVRSQASHSGQPEAHTEALTGRVVLGIDLKGAEANEAVLEFGFVEAARRSCHLQILHAWSLPPMYAYAETADPGIGEELAGNIASNLDRLVEPWRQRFPDVSVQTKAVVGAPGAELVYASPDADLLIVGRRKRPLPVGPRLGHVAHAVIHHATSPVAVVPHP
ncbi:universal stress protein [Streptomyces sp. NPDC057428]|uniref:universal stress protein n=1 Tax=Streptomyces sp. NPDC057428 TaxID=3346129 RepID=UPI0036C614EA